MTRAPRPPLRYLRDPAAIYAESFARIEREAKLGRFPPGMRAVAARIVHASGMAEAADRLAYSADAWEAGRAALEGGAPVFADCAMLAAGMTWLGSRNRVLMTLGDSRVPGLAARLGT
ncbi:MAG TPA: precorrin-8X methylmutase, partial [Paracoccaceae bacterium]|nr:precorrin-8X methylmutase [Paracoccaceae bacterium]